MKGGFIYVDEVPTIQKPNPAEITHNSRFSVVRKISFAVDQ
jgi:hypothetical protein